MRSATTLESSNPKPTGHLQDHATDVQYMATRLLVSISLLLWNDHLRNLFESVLHRRWEFSIEPSSLKRMDGSVRGRALVLRTELDCQQKDALRHQTKPSNLAPRTNTIKVQQPNQQQELLSPGPSSMSRIPEGERSALPAGSGTSLPPA